MKPISFYPLAILVCLASIFHLTDSAPHDNERGPTAIDHTPLSLPCSANIKGNLSNCPVKTFPGPTKGDLDSTALSKITNQPHKIKAKEARKPKTKPAPPPRPPLPSSTPRPQPTLVSVLCSNGEHPDPNEGLPLSDTFLYLDGDIAAAYEKTLRLRRWLPSTHGISW